MRELAVQSANATNSAADRSNLDAEYQQLGQEIGRTLTSTRFNGAAILAGAAGAQVFQVGANVGDTITVTTTDLSAAAGITAVTGGALTDAATSNTAMTNIDAALTLVNSNRALYGASQNRFEAAIANLQVGVENQSAARSRIMDADFAAETASLTRAQVLQQAGTAMLSQANSIPNNVLSLLR
jgi:flagellin